MDRIEIFTKMAVLIAEVEDMRTDLKDDKRLYSRLRDSYYYRMMRPNMVDRRVIINPSGEQLRQFFSDSPSRAFRRTTLHFPSYVKEMRSLRKQAFELMPSLTVADITAATNEDYLDRCDGIVELLIRAARRRRDWKMSFQVVCKTLVQTAGHNGGLASSPGLQCWLEKACEKMEPRTNEQFYDWLVDIAQEP